MAEFNKDYIGTNRWLMQIFGTWQEREIGISAVKKHILPKDVSDSISRMWNSKLAQVGKEIGEENIDWRIVDGGLYSKLEILKDGNWRTRMFAGEQTRIEDYFLDNGKLKLIHSPANYAESLGTNNTAPWELIKKYGGRSALADGHAVSVAITGIDSNGKECMQFFRRGKGLGEYGGYIGTVAGSSTTPDKKPFDIAGMETVQESSIALLGAYNAGFYEANVLPNFANKKDYKVLGLDVDSITLLEEARGAKRAIVRDIKGKEYKTHLLDYDKIFNMTGLALNIDNDDRDTEGKVKPHHKSEYLFLLRSGISIDSLNDKDFGWIRNDEHNETFYIPIDRKESVDFLVDNYHEIMPPTCAVTLNALGAVYGREFYIEASRILNERYPFKNHPLVELVNDKRYDLPKMII